MELHTYLTSREKTTIDKIIAAGTTLGTDNAVNADQQFNAGVLMDFVDGICKAVVAKVNGVAEDAFETLLDMESGVLDEIRGEAQKVYDASVPLEARSTKK